MLRSLDWSRFLGWKKASSGNISFWVAWGVIADWRVYPPPVAAGLDVFEHVLLRLLPRLVALAVHQLALERLEEGFRERVVPWVARRDMDWVIPWDSRRPWNVRSACWGPLSSWKTRLKSSGGLSFPTACSSASVTSFSVMRPDIDQPTTFPAERVDRGCEAGQSCV